MKRIRFIKYPLIVLLSVIVYSAAAQTSQVLYFMNLPQNHLLNPSLRPTNSMYIGLPGFSGVGISASNNLFNFSDVFIRGRADSVMTFLHPDYDIENFLPAIKDKNSLEPRLNVPIFGLGFSIGGDTYIFVDINERIEANFVLPGDIMKLGLQGNEQFRGSDIDLSSFRGDMKYYREAGIGFSKNFTNKLRLGFKTKMLFGIAAASVHNNSFGITVNDDYTHTLDADLMVNMSGPFRAYMTDDGKLDSLVFDDSRFDNGSGIARFLLNSKNFGVSFDLGASYDISDKITVSAAVTDIGYINWKSEPTNLEAKGRFEFGGFDMTRFADGSMSFDSLASATLDSLKDAFVFNDSRNPFTTFLPYGITVGGSYDLTSKVSIGLLSHSRIIGKQIKEALTLSANVNLGNALSFSLAYTAANHRYDNLGAGLSLRAGFFQIYAVADRIPVGWNRIITENGNEFIVPASWNTINARFGINFVFGNKIKKKDDKPMVLVE